MVCRMGLRIRSAIVLLVSLVGLLFWPTDPARSAPRPAPTSVTISGDGIGTPLVIRADDDAALFSALLDQVGWLRGTGQGGAIGTGDLGPKFTLVVGDQGVANQTYDLYPLAKGGPRACRPGRTSGWFYGRLTMSETLRAAGVDLPAQTEGFTGGIGGGGPLAGTSSELDPGPRIDQALGDLRRLLLLNAGIVVALTVGIAGIALLVRRRTR